jgi:1-acyl-sn-glycerol-3-phosphate acyltransferase
MRPYSSARVWAGFERVFLPWMRHRLSGVYLRGASRALPLPGLPVLLVANHVSWWDGFLLREVHRAIRPRSPFHVVMSEAQMRAHPLLRWLGAVPLGDGPLAARAMLRALEGLSADGAPVIGYFPQGRIWPSHRRPLGFQRGVDWLAGRLSPIVVVPVGLHLEPLNRSAPAAFVAVDRPVLVPNRLESGTLEARVTRVLDSLHAFLDTHGEAAPGRWGLE